MGDVCRINMKTQIYLIVREVIVKACSVTNCPCASTLWLRRDHQLWPQLGEEVESQAVILSFIKKFKL